MRPHSTLGIAALAVARARALPGEQREEGVKTGADEVDTAVAFELATIARELALDVGDCEHRVAGERLWCRALRLGGVEALERLRDRIGIEQHHRRPAVWADGLAIERHRRAATDAADRRHADPQPPELLRVERADEALLEQELCIRREAPMTVAAAVITEARRALQVLRPRERRRAARARKQRRIGGAALLTRAGDHAEQCDQRAGRELLALGGIEPQRLAVVAGVERERRERIARQRERAHGLPACGAGEVSHARSTR